jgi:hypothetical protein
MRSAALLSGTLTRLRFLPIALALVLVVPAGADAATLDAGKACYFNNTLARLSGGGFAPDSPITFTVNGRTLRETVTSDSSGDFQVRYDPPRANTERKLVIRATDSNGESGKTTIFVSRQRRVTANPDSSSDVSTWEAVLRLFGFGDGKAFIHYINPNGHHAKTVGLGKLEGPCGRLKTGKRRVMPFDNPQFGVWKLQFDTHRLFDRDRPKRRVIPVRVYRG